MKFFLIYLFFSFCFLQTCRFKPVSKEIAFYYWKTKLNLDEEEKKYLEALKVKKIYLRFFDIDWDKEQKKALPVAVLKVKKNLLYSYQIIPTIFITQRTLNALHLTELDSVVTNTTHLIFDLATQLGISKIDEIQLDTDWTAANRDKFFQVCQLMKKRLQLKKIALSSTIRLAQLIYTKENGIPPVDKGVLMFYNIGNLYAPEAPNSILNISDAVSYLKNKINYPLQLDVALPLFAWTVVYRRNKLVALLPSADFNKASSLGLVQTSQPNQYLVTQSRYLNGVYLYKNDLLKKEEMTPELLFKIKELLEKNLKNPPQNIIFFHLDSSFFEKFSIQDLKKLS